MEGYLASKVEAGVDSQVALRPRMTAKSGRSTPTGQVAGGAGCDSGALPGFRSGFARELLGSRSALRTGTRIQSELCASGSQTCHGVCRTRRLQGKARTHCERRENGVAKCWRFVWQRWVHLEAAVGLGVGPERDWQACSEATPVCAATKRDNAKRAKRDTYRETQGCPHDRTGERAARSRKRGSGWPSRERIGLAGETKAEQKVEETKAEGETDRDKWQARFHLTERLEGWLRCLVRPFSRDTFKHSGGRACDVLPLPLPNNDFFDGMWLLRASTQEHCVASDRHWHELACKWTAMVVHALNHQFGACPPGHAATMSQRACWCELWQQCMCFLRAGSIDVEHETDWNKYLRNAHVTYNGDFTSQAERLHWDQIKAGLPPRSSCGVVRAISVCEGAALDFIQEPRLHIEGLSVCPKAGVVHASTSELLPLMRNLLTWGIVAPVRKHDLVMVQGKPVLNGMFALPKPGTKVLCGDGTYRPAQRLIMDLRAGNSLLQDFPGDVATLPALHRWRNICLNGSEGMLLSYEDLKGCFYLVKLEPQWHRVFAFNAEFWAWDLGLREQFPTNERIHLGSAVCPMGWKAAVGLIQYLHRRVLGAPAGTFASACIPNAGLPLNRELRADRCTPMVSTGNLAEKSDFTRIWQVYVDDWDMLEVIELADFEQTIKEGANKWQSRARATYAALDMPTSVQKAGVRERMAQRLGIHVDGVTGKLSFPASKCARILGLVMHCLTLRLTRKQVQIVLGHMIHGLVLRRESMTCLHRSWRLLGRPQGLPLPLPEFVKREWLMVLLHLPLLQVNLRARVSPIVVASD
eukprot:2399643-Amphidinium_carterae.1